MQPEPCNTGAEATVSIPNTRNMGGEKEEETDNFYIFIWQKKDTRRSLTSLTIHIPRVNDT